MAISRYTSINHKAKFERLLQVLSTLNYKELMAYWIDQELQEAEMYYRLSQLSREVNWDEKVSKLFFDLYKESLEHSETLLKMFKTMFPNEKLPKVKLPPLEVELSEKKLRELVYKGNLKDILEFLMGTEKIAHDVYSYLAENSNNEDAKATFSWLAKIENGHYSRLRTLYTELFEKV